ncbi:MAG TPA: protein-disulfide reductase DsbD domain-containing protein [Tepidisphaeraceae bacterium]|nr:protein-disulfide reductase DsbD domain-containing protein [Tepidisphaeraceae bacterium]
MRAAAFLIPVLAVSTLVAAEAPKKELVKTESLASVSSFKPGEPFKVGIRFKIEPEWHIYWINPGESGEATMVEWTFPEGYKVGPTEYPVPVNFLQPGDIKGYGYLDEVMLMATVTPPADARPGTEVPYSAEAKWLVCHDVCIPGKASFDGKLTVASSATPTNEQLFKNWTQRLPVWDFPRIKDVVAGTKWSQPNGSDGPFELIVNWANQPPAKVEWFIGTPSDIMLKDESSSTDGSQSKLTFTPVPVPDQIIKVPVVVAFTDAAGKRQGVEFSFKLGKGPAVPKGQAAASGNNPQ